MDFKIEDAPEIEILDKENEIDKDSQMNIGLLEEHLIFLYKLQYKQDAFEAMLKLRADPDNISVSIDNDFMNAAVLNNGKVVDHIFKARWLFLGQYGFNNQTKNYFFVWAWRLLQNEKNNELIAACEKFPDDTKILTKSIITFSEPMIVSYIQAVLCDLMEFDYIKISCDENELFSMFGLKKIEWFNQIVEPAFIHE